MGAVANNRRDGEGEWGIFQNVNMAWIDRNGRRYYYRSKRLNGKVKTEAFSGRRAEVEAQADERARAERGVKTALLEEESGLEAELDRLFSEIEGLATAELEARGFYRHHRQWRRRRSKRG